MANKPKSPSAKPGDIICYDFRSASDKKWAKSLEVHGADPRPPMIKAVQWNIERGYELENIIAMLKRHQADIICLQELDIGCERTGGLDVPEIIAKELKMNCAFVVEFDEHHSPKRSKRTQGGGLHGNAILSRYEMKPFVVPHSHHPVNWARDGRKIGEPRHGERIGFGANIHVPGFQHPIRAYSLHLEVFCGIFGRLKQFADIMRDSKAHLEEYPLQMIFGDLNTMAHGIARFSPLYCSDKLRLLSVGYSEAQWWQRYIFDHATDDTEGLSPLLARHVPRNLSESDARALTNPHFYDPFCMSKDTSLHKYFNIFSGKLDWALLRGFHVLAKGMDNHDFKASDHKLLYVVLRPCFGANERELQRDLQRAYDEGRVLINHGKNFYRSIARSLALTFAFIYIYLFLRDFI